MDLETNARCLYRTWLSKRLPWKDITAVYIEGVHLDGDIENGDTVISNDLVTIQYENLPYPEFSEKELINEERHYKEDDQTLKEIFHAYTLEKSNHYMHRGNENFR